MARKQEAEPLRSIRVPNYRDGEGRAPGGARKVITDASEMKKAQLSRLADKGDVLGMESTPAEEEAPKSTKKAGK